MDQDEDSARVGTVPLFSPPLSPKITSTSHALFSKWKNKRR
ncbi:hypothetical protein PC114_g12312 [Phytophthora cactorum]|nr:hypothetical protein PC114_g12312 [Phytophthora cactorum]